MVKEIDDFNAEYFEELEEMQCVKLEEIFQEKKEEEDGNSIKSNVE